MNTPSTDRLVGDLKAVAHDTKELLKASATGLTEEVHEARDSLTDALSRAKTSCDHLQEKAVAGAKAADKMVREHTYQSIGVAFGIGVLIGVLAARK